MGVLPLQGIPLVQCSTSTSSTSGNTSRYKSRHGRVLHSFHRAELGTAWSVLCSVLLHSSLLLVGIITIL